MENIVRDLVEIQAQNLVSKKAMVPFGLKKVEKNSTTVIQQISTINGRLNMQGKLQNMPLLNGEEGSLKNVNIVERQISLKHTIGRISIINILEILKIIFVYVVHVIESTILNSMVIEGDGKKYA